MGGFVIFCLFSFLCSLFGSDLLVQSLSTSLDLSPTASSPALASGFPAPGAESLSRAHWTPERMDSVLSAVLQKDTAALNALLAQPAAPFPAKIGNELSGREILFIAIRLGYSEGALLLLPACDARAADATGATALMMAASHCDFQMIQALIPLSDPCQADEHGQTPLFHLGSGRANASAPDDFERRNSAACATALAHFCDPEQRDHRGETALMHMANWALDPLSLPAALTVCDPKATTRDGLTALMFAAKSGTPGATERILALFPYSDANARDANGTTAFDHAANRVAAGYQERHALHQLLGCADLLCESAPIERLDRLLRTYGATKLPRAFSRVEAAQLRTALNAADHSPSSTAGASSLRKPRAL